MRDGLLCTQPVPPLPQKSAFALDRAARTREAGKLPGLNEYILN